MFAPKSYYGSIMKHMTDVGFQLLAFRQIDTSMTRYHVSCEEARVSSLFFHLPGKAAIVQAAHTEVRQTGKPKYRQHWSIDVYTEAEGDLYSEWYGEQLKQRSFSEMDDFLEEMEDGPCNNQLKITDYGHPVDGGGGDWTAELRFEISRMKVRQNPNEISDTLARTIEPILPILADRFDELQITSFPPYYVFGKKGVEIFWRNFPFSRLRKKVHGKIWGSDLPTKKEN